MKKLARLYINEIVAGHRVPVSIISYHDGGYDWSYQAEEETPMNVAFMALTSLKSASSSDSEVDSCSKTCMKAYADLKNEYDSLTSDYKKSQHNLFSYKAGLQSVEERLVHYKKNEDNRSDKGYHEVPPPLTGNYMPPKCDMRLIDEHFESESVDVYNVSSSVVTTVKLLMQIIRVNTAKGKVVVNAVKGHGFNAVQASAFNNELGPQKSLTPQLKIGTSSRRSLGEENASKHRRNLKQGKQRSIFEERDFDVQSMMDADYELAGMIVGIKRLLSAVEVTTGAEVNAASVYGYYCLKSIFVEKLQLLVNAD
nr:hypothetical protein [Tanacetum cinerariifolium]